MLNILGKIFNDEVDAYQSWTLFLIFVSILVLISGVVLLTHKKPELSTTQKNALPMSRARHQGASKGDKAVVEDIEQQDDHASDERQVLWTVGHDTDDEDDGDENIEHHQP